MRAVSPAQSCLAASLTAAAAVVVFPPAAPWQGPPAALDAAVTRPSAPVITASLPPNVRFAFHHAHKPRPAPPASPRQPRTSDDLAGASLIPSPAPSPSWSPSRAPQAAPVPAPSPSASYTPLPSSSGAYGSPRAYAESLVGAAQMACLEPLWDRESGWNAYAQNPSSGAYGIPQALPGSKMASAGADWATDPDTQVRWGVGYINAIYGSPCAALAHENEDGWY